MEQRPDREPKRRGEGRPRRSSDVHEFWDGIGLDVESMSPRAQVATSLAVLIPVVVASVAVLFFFTDFWWLTFIFGWAVFPGFGLLLRGIAGLAEGEGRTGLSVGDGKERELLGALRDRGQITPTQAAMETSLSVAEADKMLQELAEGGHLRVLARGGALTYSLWDAEGGEGTRRLGGS